MYSASVLNSIKEDEQDFEWYPTTRKMISCIITDIRKNNYMNRVSVLDIGAGDGNVFRIVNDIDESLLSECFAIEKSERLINLMDKDVFVIGTDFHQQALIDKKMDVIFCNPPYSEYEQWTEKIILQANCEDIYLVIPQRWKNSKNIEFALKKRCVKAEVLSSFTFEDSEYRKARAKVDIVKIENKYSNDAFGVWFDETFKFEENEEQFSFTDSKEETVKQRLNQLVHSNDLIKSLEELYQNDLDVLYDNYRAVEKLNAEILAELGVDVSTLKRGLEQRIKGLKNKYWGELFDNLSAITDRLTFDSRRSMLSKLTNNTSVDFTASNAYSIVIWAIKNANNYLDEQLLDVYMKLTSKENISGYKSNKRFITDKWRNLDDYDFNRECKNIDNYKLEYRLVFRVYSNFQSNSFGGYDYSNGLSKNTHDYINDIFTIAKNIGFEVSETTQEVGEWKAGKEKTFTYGNNKTFAKIRAYKNGNVHCKFSQEFMLAFNIEAGRLNGWLKDPIHTNEEFEIDNANEYFKMNKQFLVCEEQSKLLISG